MEEGKRCSSGGLQEKVFHVHLVSDSTGETLMAVARAAAAQYVPMRSIEHIHSFVSEPVQADAVFAQVEKDPGIVLCTLVDSDLRRYVEDRCQKLGLPFSCVLGPIFKIFGSYLGSEGKGRIGAQHTLDAEYFRRVEALNFTIAHDDGQRLDDLELADMVLIGASRTSKTPTSMYLSNRGLKVANVPIVLGDASMDVVKRLCSPLVVGMVASVERILDIRRNRLLSLRAGLEMDYVDRRAVAEEMALTRTLCVEQGWPLIDVTHRSIEETAAALLGLYQESERRKEANGRERG